MLEDDDLWPIMCPRCGQELEKEIGRLKHTVDITCSRCGHKFGFNNETFSHALEQLKKTVDGAMRNGRFTEKKFL